MKDFNIKQIWIIFISGWFLWVCVACQPTNGFGQAAGTSTLTTPTSLVVLSIPSGDEESNSTPTITQGIIFTSTLTPTPTPTQTLMPTVTATPSLLPTLSPNEALETVITLYETNAGCLLPCWWGILPGSSHWIDVKYDLSQIAFEITEVEDDSSMPLTYGFVNLPNTYYGLDSGRPIVHGYLVEKDIVKVINVRVAEPSPLYTPGSILATYGVPEEIYMRTWQGATGYNIVFFYPQNSFRINYNITEGANENGIISACFQEGFPWVTMWSPERDLSYEEANLFFPMTDEYYLNLLDATGMDVPTFYETFNDPDVPICLETPTDIWPGY